MQEQLEKDIKSAMLAGDKLKAETLKGLKNALQYEAVAVGAQRDGLDEDQIQKVFVREAKKRQEAIDLYEKAGDPAADGRVAAETAEKAIIDTYLPAKVDESAIAAAVQAEIAKADSPTIKDMGKIIGAVRQQLGAGADGAIIAKLAKELLEK